jgi:hypothetical protein
MPPKTRSQTQAAAQGPLIPVSMASGVDSNQFRSDKKCANQVPLGPPTIPESIEHQPSGEPSISDAPIQHQTQAEASQRSSYYSLSSSGSEGNASGQSPYNSNVAYQVGILIDKLAMHLMGTSSTRFPLTQILGISGVLLEGASRWRFWVIGCREALSLAC